MFNHLNVNSRRIVYLLCNGEVVTLGNKSLKVPHDSARKLLALLSAHTTSLTQTKSIVDSVTSLYPTFDFDSIKKNMDVSNCSGGDHGYKYKVGKIKTCSFRGLAPTGREWEYDFKCNSHLIYGPNGSGKSSLLGAICWCLTGRFFRDDQPPCIPEKITAYSLDGSKKIDNRDDAQSLLDENGNSSYAIPYWIEIELIGKQQTIYLRRTCPDILTMKKDTGEWVQLQNIKEAGIDELDCELRLLMLAKISHMKFGKNPDIIRLLAEVTGYGDLESIADLAEDLAKNSKTAATNKENKELSPLNNIISECISNIIKIADNNVKKISSYEKICKSNRSTDDVKDFGLAINKLIEIFKSQLASDLGLIIPDKENIEEYKKWQEQSNNLPGLLNGLIVELNKPLNEIFVSSIDFKGLSKDEIDVIEKKLDNFEKRAIDEIKERLDWAKKELEDNHLGLMLKAANYLAEDNINCPVCTQLLDNVPEIKRELICLKVKSAKEYLHKQLDDFWRYLTGELNKIVSASQRDESRKSLMFRINEDWSNFKKIHCKELLKQIAERHDLSIDILTKEILQENYIPFKIPHSCEDSSNLYLVQFVEEINKAKNYINLCKNINSNKKDIQIKIQSILIGNEGKTAFKEILARAKTNIDSLSSLLNIQKEARTLYKGIEKAEEIKLHIRGLRSLADSADLIKVIKINIREEVKAIVNGKLGEKTKEYYKNLYDKDVFEFNQLTTGHAANPDIKTEINIYLKAGDYQVPMGPYSNAGRMRALLLSFAFALIEKSKDSLDMIILDDPALSLDDEHKARFIDHLVEPFVKTGQVVLGTHYERFYQDSESVFENNSKLVLVPKKRPSDQIVLEAGDLLEKVTKAMEIQNGNWREIAGDIRVWIERTLGTLNGYCPIPFIVFNNLPLSIDNYSKITDIRIASQRRDLIVSTLKSKSIERIIHKLHHNEPVNEPDVRDALKVIKEVEKTVNNEIAWLKTLHNHAIRHRQVHDGNKIVLNNVSFKKQEVEKNIQVIRKAAAAHNGQGIDWDINEEYSLVGNSIVHISSDAISPIGQYGQYLLLGNVEIQPKNGDLVAFETPDLKKYLRRFWQEQDGTIILEGANPTKPFKPIYVNSGKCNVRRVIGILYKQDQPNHNNEEWSLNGFSDNWFDDILGVRVKGTSLEPIARDGQIILIKKFDVKTKIKDDMLACVSIEGVGDVIKRCHISDSQIILSSINPNEREATIVTKMESIQHAYELNGVLFETGTGKSID
ncbi:MAG: hypothetical protein A2Y10_09070 [Planctomycetes bacterium GWF2_41_51]|nr:MAG: hypothetical protein A2Y10_09070 [Planctomycetes bacterium GWF2_41_51]HBG27288.1 hypothetical protein [Phycisphaerales bacterium]